MTNRKRANAPKKIEEVVADRTKVVPLMQKETGFFQELVEISNAYGKLHQQHEQYKAIKLGLEVRRKKIQKNEIKLPVQIQIAQGMFYAEDNKKEVLKYIDEQLNSINLSIKGIIGQIENHQEAYIESGLRLFEFAKNRYGIYKVKSFSPLGLNPNKNDKNVMEKELDTLFKGKVEDIKNNPEVAKAFQAAKDQAIESNSK